MPTIQSRLMNAVPRLVLGSALHPLMSSRYLILEFAGRKTDRRYSTPVAYIEEQGRLLISTDSPWWRNFTDQTPVSVRLRGRTRSATARRIDDTAASADALRRLSQLPGYSRAAGLAKVNGVVPESAIQEAVDGQRVVIAIDLAASR